MGDTTFPLDVIEKGGITRTTPEPTTADQDVVLDVLHTTAQS